MRVTITKSRSEQGCIEYSYSEDVFEPGLVHVKEIWEGREAFRLHLQSDHMKAWRSARPEFQISDRKPVLYEIGDPEPV